jgi:hypothetical protein
MVEDAWRVSSEIKKTKRILLAKQQRFDSKIFEYFERKKRARGTSTMTASSLYPRIIRNVQIQTASAVADGRTGNPGQVAYEIMDRRISKCPGLSGQKTVQEYIPCSQSGNIVQYKIPFD